MKPMGGFLHTHQLATASAAPVVPHAPPLDPFSCLLLYLLGFMALSWCRKFYGFPNARTPNSRRSELFLWLGFPVPAALLATYGAFNFYGHWSGLFVCLGFAVLPVPFYVALVYWLARLEAEPPKLIWRTFLWGATAAIFFAIFFEGYAGIWADFFFQTTPSKFFMAVFPAPLVEESCKGLALLAIFRKYSDDFDDVADGVIYAAMVGLGFTMSEDLMYYSRAWLHGGFLETEKLFGIRGLLSPYAHSLFTAMTGIGLAVGSQAWPSRWFWLKRLAPLGGFAAAVTLHSLWNYSSFSSAYWRGLGLTPRSSFLVVYGLIMVPIFGTVLLLVRASLRMERRFLREHLEGDLQAGRLSQAEYEDICAGVTRSRSFWRCLSRAAFQDWARRRGLYLAAKELAFHRSRTLLTLTANYPEEVERERGYLAELAKHRAACAPAA